MLSFNRAVCLFFFFAKISLLSYFTLPKHWLHEYKKMLRLESFLLISIIWCPRKYVVKIYVFDVEFDSKSITKKVNVNFRNSSFKILLVRLEKNIISIGLLVLVIPEFKDNVLMNVLTSSKDIFIITL